MITMCQRCTQAAWGGNSLLATDIKPGSATLAAHKDGKLITGLSGNPASAMVILQPMVLPVIKNGRQSSLMKNSGYFKMIFLKQVLGVDF